MTEEEAHMQKKKKNKEKRKQKTYWTLETKRKKVSLEWQTEESKD